MAHFTRLKANVCKTPWNFLKCLGRFHPFSVDGWASAKSSYINVLSVVMETKKDGEWHREYVDYLSDNIKNGANDSAFTVSCLHEVAVHPKVVAAKKIFIFSDNSGKHFKNRLVVAKMMDFAGVTKADVWWLFYAPDHGNSLCDGHFGRLSQKRRAAVGGSNNWATPERLSQLIDAMENTKSHIISIDRSAALVGKSVDGIQQFFSFHFDIQTRRVECFDHHGGTLRKTVCYS